MRVMKMVLLILPLALFLSVSAQAEPSIQPAPTDPQELEAAIFGTPAPLERATASYYGVCRMTCQPCWTSADCPKLNGRIQQCVDMCV